MVDADSAPGAVGQTFFQGRRALSPPTGPRAGIKRCLFFLALRGVAAADVFPCEAAIRPRRIGAFQQDRQ